LQVSETGFAHQPNCHNAPGDADFYARLLKVFAAALAVFGEDLRDGVRGGVAVRIGLLSERFDLAQLLPALLIDFFVEGQDDGM